MQLEFGDGMEFLDAAELRLALSQNASRVRERVTANTTAARERYVKMLSRMNTPHRIVARDKAAFVMGTLGAMCGHMPQKKIVHLWSMHCEFMGVLDLFYGGAWCMKAELIVMCTCRMSAFWLGKSPATFYQLYSVAAFVLFALRLFIYRSKGCSPFPAVSLEL